MEKVRKYDAPEREEDENKRFDLILALALDVGSGLLESGCSVSRVEIAVERICSAYGAPEINVFCIPSMILGSIKLSDGGEVSRMKRLYNISNNFSRMERLNQLSRNICENKYDVHIAQRMFEEANVSPKRQLPTVVIGGGLAAASFSVFFGGTLVEAVPALFIGALMVFLDALLTNRFFNGYARTFTLSIIGGTLSILFSALFGVCGVPCSYSLVMMGTIMVVIPGLLICNAIRDLFAGDLFSGTFQILNGILTALAIAAGYGVPLLFVGDLVPLTVVPQRTGLEYYLYLSFSGIIGSAAFAVMFKSNVKRLLISIENIILTFAFYIVMHTFATDNIFIETLTSTVVATAAAEILARVVKAPSTIFLVPAIIPYIPGQTLYNSMSNLVLGNMELASSYVADAGLAFLGIAVGIIVVTVLFQMIHPHKIHVGVKKLKLINRVNKSEKTK